MNSRIATGYCSEFLAVLQHLLAIGVTSVHKQEAARSLSTIFLKIVLT